MKAAPFGPRHTLANAYKAFLHAHAANKEVLANTPLRAVDALYEMVSSKIPPDAILSKSFVAGDYDQMVKCLHIPVRSICEHHLLPILGAAHFAYIPKGKIVGLSKVPRFIDALCCRLQLQERLTGEIVDVFQNTVEPHGCAVRITALHCCMVSRGVRISSIVTTTDAMRGSMVSGQSRDEWLAAVPNGLTLV